MLTDNMEERKELALERISEISTEENTSNYATYLKHVADFLLKIEKHGAWLEEGGLEKSSLDDLIAANASLYEDILPKKYDKSFANPAFLEGDKLGAVLAAIYVEIRGAIVYIYEKRDVELLALYELFLEVYGLLSDSDMSANDRYHYVTDAFYWYNSDLSDEFIGRRVREGIDPSLDFAVKIIENSDLTKANYLFKYGEYVTDVEIKTAEFIASLSKEEIESMAYTFVEGYRKGFELTGKDLKKKKTVNIRYNLGFERLVKEEIRQFRLLGLEPVIYRAASHVISKGIGGRVGYYGAIPNRQLDFDHKFDSSLFMDQDCLSRRIGALKYAYEQNKEIASYMAGPAVMEIFGEDPYLPKNNEAALRFDEKKQKLYVKYQNEASLIVNEYIKGEERSFTIIAYPTPQIGKDFEEIFKEIVVVNTLDYDTYKEIQQSIIDCLDRADYVEVKGKGQNQTDLKIKIKDIDDYSKQTVFENCLADVNIPLGEVFTTPVLAGSTGILNVSEVYLNDCKFVNLKVELKDGMVESYSCDNFEDPEDNKKYFMENVLFNHKSLPIGEFAIGTNTYAYALAKKYDILYKLPILIVEKMGPHFALGDSCYSRAEDIKVYNPDGKEIISRDNEISILRKEAADKAYFNCHTDITIPYEQIEYIRAIDKDGQACDLIRDGKFVLEGTSKLNEALSKI